MTSPIKLEPDNGYHSQNITATAQPVDSSTTQLPGQEAYPTERLWELCQETSVDKLENGVELGIEFLQKLRPAVRDLNSSTGNSYLKTIDGLLKADKRTRTVVGVVGSTGAGKSSILNAVLNEPQLLPTSCMRACTAAVTELSFNHSNDPAEKYRAEVEFLSPQDWATELQLLWDYLIDSGGKIRPEARTKDEDSKIALDKLKAVYPTFGESASSVYSRKELAEHPSVLEVLGTTKKFQAKKAAGLVTQLQPYIDSKERGEHVDVMEVWPLVKVVRIYTKADALAHGVVLVDLPGVHDSNAARAAVADKYIEECSGQWILAPILRAVDDKSAKTLLGKAFKHQLQFDGMFGKITFICSKTDSIVVSESVKSLKLEKQAQEKWDRIKQINEERICAQNEQEQLDSKMKSLELDINKMNRELWTWSRLSKGFSAGLKVYPPPPEVVSMKRKHQTRQTRNSRDLSSSEDSEDTLLSENELTENDVTDNNPSTTSPLTRMDIDKKIASLMEALKQLESQHLEAQDEAYKSFKILKLKLKAFEKEVAEQRNELAMMCIKGRNDYSRKAIRQDFAMGIRELDEAALIDEDESLFNPDVDFRDYGRVADSLPVFCVSSHAYQHLCGRNEQDNFNAEGFRCVEDTEIPQLAKHVQGMTETSRVSHCRRFLNDLLQLVESMSIWTRPREDQAQANDEEQNSFHDNLRRELEAVKIALETATDVCVTTIQDHFSNLIISTLDSKIPAARSAAVDVCRGWSAPEREGGMHWISYRATIRRNGCYNGATGSKDFNSELLEPIIASLASAWEETFLRRIPVAIDTLTTSIQTALRVLYTHFTNANTFPGSAQDLAALGRQTDRYLATAAGILNDVQQHITNAQRQANRQLEPIIVLSMTPGYRQALEEKGSGSYKRMKDIMAAHVEVVRHTMFEKAKQTVQDCLAAMIDKAQEVLKRLESEINGIILQDYTRVLPGNSPEYQKNKANQLGKIAEILATVDKQFTPASEAAPATGTAREVISLL
ncbi:uncharacterized protein PgNI_04082 [Pyricularia grisea]|uniref:Uncharacterized protein n=1 Tax=Pyricularia grisea TaxID=148305 RepID=A0A6P8BCP9_PYRGI|nr:uncharacterized protein PgNI_04082 [Pyricularia grisea]TLD13539.1 hypothetical protein PgNI_04082 [Pyricularia grisea]